MRRKSSTRKYSMKYQVVLTQEELHTKMIGE